MTTPIVDFIKEYAKKNTLRLHMPGHKGVDFLGIERSDITEISGADVLYNSNGIIAQSERNASMLFGTGKTVYSAEGSSLAIRAMLFMVKMYAATLGREAFVLAGRNAHKTFLTAAALLDIKVDWLTENNTRGILSCKISAEHLEGYLASAQEKPVAVYITSPDYLGNMTDVALLSEVCKRYNVLLLVDNAHGAYLRFLEQDKHPISLGADICCDSAHKTLPVLTGGAYLHISEKAPNFFFDSAYAAMSVFASTSPSYLILQSLDMVNALLDGNYRKRLAEFVGKVKCLKEHIAKKGFTILGDEELKITIAAKEYGYTGEEFAQLLRQKGIECEFSDPDYTVMMLTPEIGDLGLKRLADALLSVERQTPITLLPPVLGNAERKISIRQALFSSSRECAVGESLGKILASPTVGCPPAVPIVISGELIDENKIECLKYYGINTCFVVDDTANDNKE